MSTKAITFAGESMVLHVSGGLIWPRAKAVLLSDMHLEKASAFAQSGQFLPPYDTLRTLDKLDAFLENSHMEKVYFLGDSFQDDAAVDRMPDTLLKRLGGLADRFGLTWITGNHDPSFPQLPGAYATEVEIFDILLRHEPTDEPESAAPAQIFGHFHPKARVEGRGRPVTKPCFIVGERRLVLPAFGAFVGGLSVKDPAIMQHFQTPIQTYVMGQKALHHFPATALTTKRRR